MIFRPSVVRPHTEARPYWCIVKLFINLQPIQLKIKIQTTSVNIKFGSDEVLVTWMYKPPNTPPCQSQVNTLIKNTWRS